MPSRLYHIVPVFLISLISALILSGCQTPPDGPSEQAYTTEERAIQRAQQLVADARDLAPPARDQRLLAAAEAFAEGDDQQRARQVLAGVEVEELAIPERARFKLLGADLALGDADFLQARRALDDEEVNNALQQLSGELRRRWHHKRGEVFALVGETRRSLYEYVRLVRLLEDEQAIRRIHDTIWQELARLPAPALEEGRITTSDADLEGWFELAEIRRRHRGDIASQLARVDRWLERNSAHPAAMVLPSALQRAADMDTSVPGRIALLLPSSGDFGPPAEAIRDGVMAAYYDVMAGGGRVPVMRLYDSQSAPVAEVYRRAVDEGAELIIGPLQQKKLQELLTLPELSVPVLGLDYLETANPHDNLYQFGLSIRDEATQAAERAWIAGHRSALVLTPRTGWGESAREAFRTAWEERGGRVVPVPPYSAGEEGYSDLLRPALLVDHSEQRAQRLIRTLGKSVDYSARRRSDIDMIFLVAYPGVGRQIKPTLDFLYAGDVPVYATSHIYSGVPNPTEDQDLDGIRFSAMPWTLGEAGEGDIRPGSEVAPAYRNLFAMGADAYRLHQWLHLLQSLPDTEIQGATGRLSLGEENQVVRRQPWALFRQGVPRAAPLPEGVDGQ